MVVVSVSWLSVYSSSKLCCSCHPRWPLRRLFLCARQLRKRGGALMGVRRLRVVCALLVVGLVGCSADTPESRSDVGEFGETTPGISADPEPGVAPEPIWQPAPALACDGSTVLCVDAAASGSAADGSAVRPFRTIGAALAASGPGAVIQVAGGEYEESIAIESLTGLRIVGGFVPSRDFSSRDPEVNETILRGAPEHAVVSIAASTDILIEGFRITGGGASSTATRSQAEESSSTIVAIGDA